MSRKLTALFAAALAAALASLPASAADPAPADDAAAQAARAQEEANPLLPTKADMEKARADREAGRIPEVPQRGTTVKQVRDQNNHVTEYIVTPGTTHIPYTIQNQADRPADFTPGGNSKGTMGTTRQIKIGW